MGNILEKLKNRIRRKKKTMAGFMAFCLVVTSFALHPLLWLWRPLRRLAVRILLTKLL